MSGDFPLEATASDARVEFPDSLHTRLRNAPEYGAETRCREIGGEVWAALEAASPHHRLRALRRAQDRLLELRKYVGANLRGRMGAGYGEVTRKWLALVDAEIARLEERERARIPNPYVSPRPLRPGDTAFVGRTAEFRFLEEQFLDAEQNVPVVLFGQRRIGKTSFLQHLQARFTGDLIPLFVDLQDVVSEVKHTGEFLGNLAQTIADRLQEQEIAVTTPTAAELEAGAFPAFGRFLDRLEAVLRVRKQRVVLALDEFEELEKKLTSGVLSPDLLGYFRSMMQHRRELSLLFAGSHTLDRMIHTEWTAYFRSAVPCRLSYLDPEAAEQLILHPLREEPFPLRYEPDAVEHLVALTHRHPALLQIILRLIVDRMNDSGGPVATVADVDAVLPLALDRGDYVFRGIWEWIPERGRTLLVALAHAIEPTEAALAATLGGDPVATQDTLRRLEELELVEPIPGESAAGAWRFQVELLRLWVQRRISRTAG